ncbi:uncharacterized protein LOC144624228 [Crassostrea virginica]
MKLQVKRKRLFKKLNKKGEGYTIDMPYKITHMEGLKMKVEKMPDKSKMGYRLMDLEQVDCFLADVTRHVCICPGALNLALKGMRPTTPLTEINSFGLASTIGVLCQGCNQMIKHDTSKRLNCLHSKKYDVNVRAVWGSMVTGNGCDHLNELFGTLNSPGLRQGTFTTIEEEISEMWRSVLEEEMLAAGEEERRLAIQNNEYHQGVPYITVIADGGWSKRSHKHTYNASGGVAIIIGKRTGKILYIGIRNKYCYICSTQSEPAEHKCFKNWTQSSQAMESDIIVEGFKKAEEVHGVRYLKLIADGDSSVYAKIHEEVPIWGKYVTKIECSNHACKCLRSNLEKLVNDNPIYKGQNKLSKPTRVRLVSAVRCAIRMRSQENSPMSARKIAHDIRNSIHHIFGNHEKCSDFCKAKSTITPETNDGNASVGENMDEENLFDDQYAFWTEGSSISAQEQSRLHSPNTHYTSLDKQMLADVSVLLNRLASKSDRLIGNNTTNAAEAWMHIRSKFDGGKFNNLCNRGSWHARCYGAAARQNLGTKWATTVWESSTKTSPGYFFIEMYNKRDKDYENTKKSVKRPDHQKKRWQKKMKGWSESTSKKARREYGPNSTEVCDDLDITTLEQLKEEYLKLHIEISNDKLDQIEKQTVQQSASQVWKSERKKRLTASNYGKIVRRNPKLKVTPLVKDLLYSNFKGNRCTVKGLQEERNTIHEYILKKAELGHNVTVEPVGLIVNRQHKFLAASPDGKVKDSNGDIGLIEIKNLLQNKNISFMQATKTVKDFCLVEKNGVLSLKKNHLYYYQCQGLVNVTGLPWIDFVVRSLSPYQIHIERIYSDKDLWNEIMLPKLTAFYHQVLLSELAAPRYNKVPGIREPGIWVGIIDFTNIAFNIPSFIMIHYQ